MRFCVLLKWPEGTQHVMAGSSELASRWVMHFVSRLEGGSAATDETRVPPRTVGAPPSSLRIGRLDSLHHAR